MAWSRIVRKGFRHVLSQTRRAGPPQQISVRPEELCRFEVPLGQQLSADWVRLFEDPHGRSEGDSVPLGTVVGSRILFECAEEEVLICVKQIDAHITRTNDRHRDECRHQRTALAGISARESQGAA